MDEKQEEGRDYTYSELGHFVEKLKALENKVQEYKQHQKKDICQ